MSSQIVVVTAQAAMFSALSTGVAQGITVWRHQKLPVIDLTSFLNFMLIAVITTPPNYLDQHMLEDTFPSKIRTVQAKTDDKKSKTSQTERLSIANTLVKFFLNQSIGAAGNTIMFISLLGLLKGKSLPHVATDVQKDFWPFLTAGWRLWPMLTLLNLMVVPFEYRMLVGNTAGVLWGVYMALKVV